MGRHPKRRAGWNAGRTWAVLGLLAFCLALALPLYAAEPAPGVDAWAALEFPGLDIRDSANRLVSRSALEKGLREGSRQSADKSAELSNLAGLKALLAFLEGSDLLAASWRGEPPISRRGEAAFAVAPRKTPKVRPPPAVFGAAPEPRAAFTPSPLLLRTTPGLVRVLNLRE